MSLLAPASDAAHVVTADGESFIWQPRDWVVAQQGRGVLSMPHARSFIDFYRRVLVPGRLVRVFDDFGELTHNTRDARESLTELTNDVRSALDGIHIFLTSKFMALGVSAFKHDTEDALVHVYTDPASFLRVYRETLDHGLRAVAELTDSGKKPT